jgi:hypothetical protein
LDACAAVDTVTELLQNPSMMLALGVIPLAAGLVMVLARQYLVAVLALIVTLVGWVTLIKSLSFLFLPPEIDTRLFLGQLHYRKLF